MDNVFTNASKKLAFRTGSDSIVKAELAKRGILFTANPNPDNVKS